MKDIDIIKFMNLDIKQGIGGLRFLHHQHWVLVSNAKYSTSWEWLMPIVEKIESLAFPVDICENMCIIYGKEELQQFTSIGDNKLEATYNAVVKFVTYFNTQPK